MLSISSFSLYLMSLYLFRSPRPFSQSFPSSSPQYLHGGMCHQCGCPLRDPPTKNLSGALSYGVQGQVRMGAKSHSNLTFMVQDQRRQSLALYSVWNGEAGLLHIKTSWRTSLGLQYVSNLLSSGGYCTLHKSQILPQIWWRLQSRKGFLSSWMTRNLADVICWE